MTYAVGTQIDLRPTANKAVETSREVAAKEYEAGTRLTFQFFNNTCKVVRHIPVVFA